MKIGLIVAMEKEEQLVRDQLTDGGGFVGHWIVTAGSGVGKVNAAITAIAMINDERPDIIVSTGVAGGVDAAIADVMDVVIGTGAAYHDVDCGPDVEPGRVQGLPRVFASDESLVEIAKRAADAACVHTAAGLIATGDRFISEPEEVERIRRLYPEAAAVDMESAAIAHVCFLNGVPFLPVRVVSDVPGVQNRFSQYRDFWDRVGSRSFGFLRAFLTAV